MRGNDQSPRDRIASAIPAGSSSPSTGSQEVLHADADSGEGNIADSWTPQDEFQRAAR